MDALSGRVHGPWHDAQLAIHVGLTGVMGWIAGILAWPGETFRTGVAYAVMEQLAPENMWAMAFWLVATIGVVGLITQSRVARLLSVLVLASAHGVLALCFALANPSSTGSGTYAVLAGLGYYLAWRRSDEGV